MSFDLPNDIENGEIDDFLAKAQEESLRYYNEVELPRLQKERGTKDNKDDNVLSSQVGGKAGSILYDGADASGFHLDAGKTYIYPTNYPVRQYQATMVKTALFQNTMVSLPTGLGKTFIAAVVMYNFYRWYPNGKVVFMAPTRPLVAQQTKACHHVMNIPVDHTAELTGMQNVEEREKLWKEKRVFYLTPQVMVNDLKSRTCPATLIKCIVIDEAHRATKDYAYCQVLKLLSSETDSLFRVLGLSATPGNDINAVQQVVRNLGISALEMRSEDSLDVAPYTHSRSVDKVVVELSGNILRVKEDLLQVFEKYAKRLKDFKALSNNIANVSKFQVLKACEKFRANPPKGVPSSVIGNLISDFTVCMSLAHSLELLQTYGLRAFYKYLSDDNSEKTKAAATRLRNDEDLKEMLKRLQACLFPKVSNENSYTWSHPKLKNLASSLSRHFQQYQANGQPTKAIVFCQYRIVVSEIVELLSKFKPLIKATEFIGQSGGKEKGMPQAKQLQIMKDFRNGFINCLVATCVAEEGLDIGEVDLIVLMEAHKSPVRLVQRIGRTGRKRKGQCLVLLTKGREEQKFHEAMATRKSYVENIMKSSAVKASLQQVSPRMIPIQFNPILQLVHINVSDLVSPAKPQIKKQADIRKCFTSDSPFLPDEELLKVLEQLGQSNLTFDRLPKLEEVWYRRFDKKINIDELLSKSNSKLSEWNEWNHEEHETYHIDHTSNSKLLCHVLKLASNEIDLPNFETITKSGDIGTASNFNSNRVENYLEADRCSSPHKRKKLKKETAKINLGMDIRDCLGIAVEKSAPVQKQIIDLISEGGDESGSDICNASSINDVFQGKTTDCRVDILTGLYIEENRPLRNLDKFVPFNINISKTWTCTRHLPKLETFFANITTEIIENIEFSSMLPTKYNTPKSDKVLISNEFVQIDDLFDSGSDNDDIFASSCLNTAISECHENIPNLKNDTNQINRPSNIKCEDLCTEMTGRQGLESWDVDCLTSNDGLGDFKTFNSSNQKCIKSNMKNDNVLNITSFQEDVNQFTYDEKFNHFNNTVKKLESVTKAFSSIINEQENNVLLPSHCVSPHKKPKMSSIVSSTPNPTVKNFRKNLMKMHNSQSISVINEMSEEHQSPPSDSSEMWNLSDLFEEEEIKIDLENEKFPVDNSRDKNYDLLHRKNSFTNVNDDVHNSTMLGITQMVSLIESEKAKCKQSDFCNVVVNNNDNENVKEYTDKQNENNLSDYLDCDAEIFSQVNDESIFPKHSKEFEKVAKIPNAPYNEIPNSVVPISECKEFRCTDKIQKNSEMKLSSQINRTTLDSQSSEVVNFKKFTAKKALFPKVKNINNFTQNSLLNSNKNNDYPSNSENLFLSYRNSETTLIDFEKPTSSNKVGCEKPSKSKLFLESLKMFDEFKSNEEKASINVGSGSGTQKNTCKNTKFDFISDHKVQNRILLDENKSKHSTEFTSDINKTYPNSMKKPIWNIVDSDDSEVFEPLSPKKKKKILKERKEEFHHKIRKNKRKESNDFIEKEADVSGTKMSSDDSDGSSLDDVDNSFINDNSEYISNETQAIYLKSVKSPFNKGTFKIPAKKSYIENIYSQQVEEDSEYINDSFCVDSEEEEESPNSLSLLEIAERKLANNKNKISSKNKRRRILNSSDDSSSPEKPCVSLVSMSQPSPKLLGANKKKRRIQSDSETEKSPSRKKFSPTTRTKKINRTDKLLSHNYKINSKKEDGEHNRLIINLSSDEEKEVKEKSIDLTLSDRKEDNSDTYFERKFQEDLKKAIIRSQSDFAQNISPHAVQKSSKVSTPKSKNKILNLKKFDESVRKLNEKFSERLNKIKTKFCLSDESFSD